MYIFDYNSIWLSVLVILIGWVLISFTLLLLWIGAIEVSRFLQHRKADKASREAVSNYIRQIEEIPDELH